MCIRDRTKIAEPSLPGHTVLYHSMCTPCLIGVAILISVISALITTERIINRKNRNLIKLKSPHYNLYYELIVTIFKPDLVHASSLPFQNLLLYTYPISKIPLGSGFKGSEISYSAIPFGPMLSAAISSFTDI